MNHFEAREGELFCEATPLTAIAAAVGTPAYVYSTATLERHYQVFEAALAAHPGLGAPLIAYAVKANSNLSVLRTLAALGAGADTVSEGEIRRALAAGIDAGKIVFSGVGKTRGEIAFALKVGVRQINVESEPELAAIVALAGELGVRPALALRVNPDIEAAGGHAKISTAGSASKFGVAVAAAEGLYARSVAEPSVRMVGLACHIGSQITQLAPLETAFARMAELAQRLRGAGHAVERLDLGGGLGVPYFNQPDPPSPDAFSAMAAGVVGGLKVELTFEPGRVLAANAGVLIAGVIHVNERPDGRRFLVLDAAMNDLLRPAMYDAWHDVRPVKPRPGVPLAYDIVGPVCESGDTFARGRMLPPLQAGDLVAFFSSGAYGAVMASEYNTRPLIPEVLVRGAQFAVVRERPSFEAMLAREPLAPWL
ncbi:MAG TPA: diaminopimelate decarboxylase [Caulobacteraceae bacterium]